MYKILFLLIPITIFAHMNIAVSYPYIGAITKTIGGEHVDTTVLAKGKWDPHFIVPRPSLISKMRRADGLIINGAQLEIGWLPQLINRSANPKVNPNAKTFLDLSTHINLINKPQSVSRSGGDLHPDGNPHFHLDPNNILILAEAIKDYLVTIDSVNSGAYEKNYANFKHSWSEKLIGWSKKMQSKKGVKVIQFHDVLAYFTKRYSLKTIATIEPLPGIPPSAKHTMGLIKLIKQEKPYAILHDVYHSTKTAKFISKKTGLPIIIVPHDVGAIESVKDLSSLFDYLTSAIK